MATVSIEVPNALVPRLKAAMRATFPEHAELGDVEAFKAATAAYWRGVLVEHESREAEVAAWAAQKQAVADAKAAAESDGTGIG